MAPPPADDDGQQMIGQIVAGYRLASRIGAGGMGEVYVGEHLRIDRRVAIKLLRVEMSSRTDMVARFFGEARATSSIHHPGIVEVLDCDVQNGRAYIVMELLEGQSLLARMTHDRTFGSDERVALALTAEIASALEAAHRKHIVHRDLKPDNVFLVRDARSAHGFVVKILDFGIAKLLSTDGDGRAGVARTRTGAVLGTPIYMSPEQCRGAAAVDWRADIYSMGCILFELLAGRPPFTYEGFGELIAAHMSEPPPHLLALRPRITPAVAAFVARLLEKDPAHRPQSMEAAGQEIAALLAQITATSEMRARRTEPMPAQAAAPVSHLSEPASGAGGGRLITNPGGTLLADAPMSIDVRDSLAPPDFVDRSQTTLSEMASEEMLGRRTKSRGRGKVWASIVVVAGAAAGVFAYMKNEVGPVAPATSARPVVSATPPPMPIPRTVRVQIGDAPPLLTATVDGRPVALPLVLPAGPETHTVVFRAPGYGDRNLVIDGEADRTLLLGMARLPSPAVERRSRAAPPGATRHHRRVEEEAAPAAPQPPPPLDLDDDERKL